MKAFLLRWFCTTVAVAVAAHLTGIQYESAGALMLAALLLGIVNALVRPVLLFLSLPFILVTLGFFILVVNGLLMWLVGNLVPGFHVEGFWQAFFGAMIVSTVSWVLSGFLRAGDDKPLQWRVQVSSQAPNLEERTVKTVRGRVVE